MTIKHLQIILASMLLVAVLPMPYEYYKLLRVVVFGACLFIAYGLHYYGGNKITIYGLLGVSILYNPIISFHFPKEIWVFVNIATAVLFIIPSKLTGIAATRENIDHVKHKGLDDR